MSEMQVSNNAFDAWWRGHLRAAEAHSNIGPEERKPPPEVREAFHWGYVIAKTEGCE